MGSYSGALARGALSGFLASVVQVVVGWALDALLRSRFSHRRIRPGQEEVLQALASGALDRP
jgi:hypothetical protein